jgi:extracellular factor (EF) 3-hydroxypalmitic acid methyl ester biosynthesis protein
MTKAIEQEVAVLSSNQGLRYLTVNDWSLMIDKASRVHFRKGTTLVERGKKLDGIFLLLKGSARVQLPMRSSGRMIGPGEICGEMSFLEDALASATVVVEEDMDGYHIDRSTLEGLFELFPHMASRFYRSVAMNLSRRLRDLIGPAEGLAKNQKSAL